MIISDLRAELEEDLAWRLDELRHLRNLLLGDTPKEEWPTSSMRAILVMQYAHLEGLAKNAFSLYVQAINSSALPVETLHPALFAAAVAAEFQGLRVGGGEPVEDEDGVFLRRAKKQVAFVGKLNSMRGKPVKIEVDRAVSMEMNLGSDVLKRTLYLLGIPDVKIDAAQYGSLEFVRRTRNDVGHGSRTENIKPGVFDAHTRKCESFMGDVIRLVTTAVAGQWFRADVAVP